MDVDWTNGYCGTTETGAGDCERGDRGSWILPSAKLVSWNVAAPACVELCRRCQRCNAVSLSLKFSECSWYSECARVQLLIGGQPSGFRTVWNVHQGHTAPRPRTMAAEAHPTERFALRKLRRSELHTFDVRRRGFKPLAPAPT